MDQKKPDTLRFLWDEIASDQVNERRRERLKEDLDLDDGAVEVVMSLRRQIILLQTHVYELEFTLHMYQLQYGSRQKIYPPDFSEGDWEDIENSLKG